MNTSADILAAQMLLTAAHEKLLDAFAKSSDPAHLLRLIEDLAILQERITTISHTRPS